MTHDSTTSSGDYEMVRRNLEFLRENWRDQPSLDELASHNGVSGAHLQRLFMRWAGLSPKAFLQALTIDHARKLLRDSASVLDTAYEVGLSAERLERVGKWLQAEVDGRKIPGAVLLVARQDKVAYLESFGRHDPGAAAPMTHYPIFRIFLMTKPIASVAAMMLVEDGRLSLDDPRVRHISEFARQDGLSRRPGRSRCR